jgi:hypothetical protein
MPDQYLETALLVVNPRTTYTFTLGKCASGDECKDSRCYSGGQHVRKLGDVAEHEHAQEQAVDAVPHLSANPEIVPATTASTGWSAYEDARAAVKKKE